MITVVGEAKSATTPGKTYEIKFNDETGVVFCTCAWSKKGFVTTWPRTPKPCHHIVDFAKQYVAEHEEAAAC